MDADSNSKRKKCLKLVCWELHISRFSLSHHNWKAFGYTPVRYQVQTASYYYCLMLSITVAATEIIIPMGLSHIQMVFGHIFLDSLLVSLEW
jgi:hypothetical protein